MLYVIQKPETIDKIELLFGWEQWAIRQAADLFYTEHQHRNGIIGTVKEYPTRVKVEINLFGRNKERREL